MPSGPGVIGDELIASIAENAPPGVSTFLLTSRTDGALIAEQVEAAHVTTVQIVDAVEEREYGVIRRAMPHLKIVQVLHVWGEDALEEARRVLPHVDGLLLDSGSPNSEVKLLGGTGRTHNWEVSARIVSMAHAGSTTPRPVFLAGGLHAGNARDAIHRVRPYGLDVCSGVRSDGRLDESKVRALAQEMRSA